MYLFSEILACGVWQLLCNAIVDSSQGRSGFALNQQLSQFSREVVDLLKRMPGCQMSFSKFIPSYHHHFGRQCRVADFGFTKLQELFEAIPHVLQVRIILKVGHYFYYMKNPGMCFSQ